MASIKDFERAMVQKEAIGKTTLDKVHQKDQYISNLHDHGDRLIEAYDQKEVLQSHAKWIAKLRSGKVDVQQFLGAVAPDAAVNLLNIAINGSSDKVKLAATSDLLDRVGYSKVNKHAIAGSIDASSSKEELISMIAGLSSKTKVIEIIDEDNEETTSVDESGRASSGREEA